MKFISIIIFFFLKISILSASVALVDENKIYKNLRCLVCQGQSIADSNSDFALTVKSVVKDLIDQEKTEDEIYYFLSDKYGEWILYNPKMNKNNFILWIFPYISLILGGLFIFILIRKTAKKS